MNRLISLVLFFSPVLVVGAVHAEVNRYDAYQRVQVDIKTPAQLAALQLIDGVIIENEYPAVGPTYIVVSPAQLDQVRQLGARTKILQDNVQPLIDAQLATLHREDPFDDFFLDYHPYGSAGTTGSILWYLNELVVRHPTRASMFIAGNTEEDRPIWVIRITNDDTGNKPAVVYFGCEHAREWITTTIIPYFANHLLENYGTDPVVTDLVDNVEFLLIPVFNVDGYEYSRSSDRWWRKNRRYLGSGVYGVDLNRNWGEGWGGAGASSNPSDPTYRGPGPFSELETQVLRDFFLDRPNIRAQLDIHSFSQLILWPFGYTPALPLDNDIYEDVGFAMQSLIYSVHGVPYAAGPVYSAIYPASGVSVDWTYAERDVFSFSFELRDTGNYGFLLPPDQIIPNNEEILPAMLHLTDSEWVRLPIRFEFPDGVPPVLAAGADTTFAVNIVSQYEAVASGTPAMYYRYDPAAPFTEVPLTWLGGAAYSATLPATNCTSTPEFYFTADTDAGSTVTSPRAAPAELHSAGIATGTATFFTEHLSANPNWTVEGEWAFGDPAHQGGDHGGPDPDTGHTGPFVYGYDLFGDYGVDIPEYHLTSRPVDCTGRWGTHLTFWRWLGVEQPAYDHAYVRVSNNGTGWVNVWQNAVEITDSSWVFQDIDISAVADNQPSVYLRWTMGETDGAWEYCGWNVDDVDLAGSVCDGQPGDYDGDGDLDVDDYNQFAPCFAGPQTPAPPNCGVFDFDEDDDVDCTDWNGFQAAWSGGQPPVFAPCQLINPPLPDGPAKNRFLSFVPNNGDTPVAFRVNLIEAAYFPGSNVSGWVGVPDENGQSLVVDTPMFRTWSEDVVYVGDCEIAAVATYEIRATLDGTGFTEPLALTTTARPGERFWADCVGALEGGAWSAPDGVVSFNDIQAAIMKFETDLASLHWTRVDLDGETPNAVINMADVQRIVLAFEGEGYPFPDPALCP